MQRERFSASEIDLGVEGDFLYLSQEQVTHFRDRSLFQVLWFPEGEFPNPRRPYFYYSFCHGFLRSDLLLYNPSNTYLFEVTKVRIGMMDRANFWFFEYEKDDSEVSGFLLGSGKLRKLKWRSNQEFSFDWRKKLRDGESIGPVLMMGGNGDVLFRQRIIFSKGRLMIQTTAKDHFDDQSALLNVDIQQIIRSAEVEDIFEKFKNLLKQVRQEEKSRSQNLGIEFCSLLQKKFSNFFPMFTE